MHLRKCMLCNVESVDPSVVLKRFPKPGVYNLRRCELWAKFCFPLTQFSLEFSNKLYSEHRMLCTQHFDRSSFSNFENKIMYRDAVPSILAYEDTDRGHDLREINVPCTSTSQAKYVIGQMSKVIPNEFHTSSGNDFHETISFPSTSTTSQTSEMCQIPMVISDEFGTNKDIDFHQNIPLPDISTSQRVENNLVEKLDEKAKIYYEKSRKYLQKICKLKNSLKKMKCHQKLKVLHDDSNVKELEKWISPTFASILQSQLKNHTRKPKGRRWTQEDKIIALRIYKRSPTSYRLLSRLFTLPSPSTLKALLGSFDMPPGINIKVINQLKKYCQSLKPSDNNFVLMFDEMSIRKNLQYNVKKDLIEGYQDHGSCHGRTEQEAVKVLVFMIAGIRKPVKQPLAYYLSGANVTADRLTVLIKEILVTCIEAGIVISATVCDMGGTNRRSLTTLGASSDHPFIKIKDKEIVTMFDTPHLLKCFRNMFYKYDIKCSTDIVSNEEFGQGIAKWSHIKQFYEIDSKNPNFVFAPALKKEHLEPNAKQKMKVKLAAQVFSHTVACGIFNKVSNGSLPAEAVVTGNLLSKIDKLFDLMNSDSKDRYRGKPYATNMSKKSPHLKYFREMKEFFKNIVFVGSPRPPPSIEGWIWTMNGLERLWDHMKQFPDVKGLATRRLQQDALENLFGCIRGNCGSNANPTTSAFIGGLKTAIMSNLSKISAGNCEEDKSQCIIENFKCLLSSSQKENIIVESTEQPITDIGFEETERSQIHNQVEFSTQPLIDMTDLEELENVGDMQACAYVAGFINKNNVNIRECVLCMAINETSAPTEIHNFVENKEYYDKKKCLKYSSNELVYCVNKCATIINDFLSKSSSQLKLKATVKSILQDDIFDFLKSCPDHYNENKAYIKTSMFHICVKRYCTIKNRKYSEEASQAAVRRRMNIFRNV